MKKILLVLFLNIVFITSVHADGIFLSTSQLTMAPGESKTFTVSADNASCIFSSVSSSDTSCIDVSASVMMADVGTPSTITVRGKRDCSARVTIVFSPGNCATWELVDITGSRSVSVRVQSPTTQAPVTQAPVTQAPTQARETTTRRQETTTLETEAVLGEETTVTTTQIVRKNIITKFEIFGLDLDFKEETYEYNLDIYNQDKLYINVEGDNITVEGDKEVSIKDKESIIIKIIDNETNEIKEYKINLNRIKSDNKKCSKLLSIILGILLGIATIIIIIESIIIIRLVKLSNQKNQLD